MAAGPVGSVWAEGCWADTCWEDGVWAEASEGGITFDGRGNELLYVFLCDHFGVTGGDLTTMATKYMDALTSGDRTQRWKQMEADAIAAVT